MRPVSVASQAVVDSFVLVNAKTGLDIMVLDDLDVIRTQDVGTELSIRAEARNVDCLEFNYDEGQLRRMDSVAPFYLAGNVDAEINIAYSLADIGLHSLTACPSTCQLFAQRTAEEVQGCYTIHFEVANGAGGAAIVDFLENKVDPDVVPYTADTFGLLTGELKQWHTVTIGLTGPPASEMGMTNPGAYRAATVFADYKLDITFVNEDGTKYVVPGYYAGNGNTANDGSIGGSDFQVHFAVPKTGHWTWTARFREGTNVAQTGGGNPGFFFDGANGDFTVEASDKTGADFRSKGRIVMSNGRWQFSGTGESFLKVGVASPSDLLAYADIDNTPNNYGNLKTYSAHELDYESGNLSWAGGKGSGLIGAIKGNPKLAEMELIRQSRLSVAPVRPAEWKEILKMAGE